MDRVSTGLKVTKASDDPYVMGQSETQRMQIRGLQMAQRNVQDGISMLQATGDALDSATGILHRIRDLAVQAGSGALSGADRTTLQGEIDQMLDAIDNVMKNNEFNGVKLLYDPSVVSNTTPSNLQMTGGANANETVNIPQFNLSLDLIGDEASGKLLSSINVMTMDSVGETLNVVDSSIKTILDIRTQYGALENKFESMYTNVDEISSAIQKAESGIRDADIAEELMDLSKFNLLNEVGNSLLAQTNNFPMEVLKILENVRR